MKNSLSVCTEGTDDLHHQVHFKNKQAHGLKHLSMIVPVPSCHRVLPCRLFYSNILSMQCVNHHFVFVQSFSPIVTFNEAAGVALVLEQEAVL